MARLDDASTQASLIDQHASDDRDRRIAERLDAMAVDAGLSPSDAAAVVGTGVDPVTSRFSGARSAN